MTLMSMMRVSMGLIALCAAGASHGTEAAPMTSAAKGLNADVLTRYPAPGRMVDVGGRKLHLHCKGPATSPVVIIEAGAMGAGVWYWKAQDEVAKVARACTYDRAGLGWSDPVPGPRTLEARVDDLHQLLKSSGEAGPYIIAAHSMGGVLAQMYARKYPDQLLGLVLLESSERQVNTTDESHTRTTENARQLGLAANAAAMGIDIPQLRIPGGPPEQEVMLRESVFRAGQDDLLAMSKLREEQHKLGSLGGLPLVVISRGKKDPGRTDAQTVEWDEGQARLAKLSTRSVAIRADNCGHNIMADDPSRYAQGVKEVLALSRR